MTEKRYSVWHNEAAALAEGAEYETWEEADADIENYYSDWCIWRHNADGTVTECTNERPVTDQTDHETMSAAYDQGVEDGQKQERERVQKQIKILTDCIGMLTYGVGSRAIISAKENNDIVAMLADVEELGAVTTEESEK